VFGVCLVSIEVADLHVVFSGLNLAVQDNNSTFTISGRFVDTGTPYLALSLTTTVYVTIAISYRIWSLSYNPKDDGESRFTYTNVIAIVVESALLYSIALLIMVVLIIRKNPIYRYLQDIVAQIVVGSSLVSSQFRNR